MKYNFVYKRNNDWSFEEEKIIEQTIALVSNPIAGDPFLAVGRHLADITKVKFLIIGRNVPSEADKVQTVCFLNYGRPLANITYLLNGTPCQHVFDYDICYYPVGVKEEFPEDKDLVDMNINSYMGTPLSDNAGNKIGLLVLLHDKTIQNPGFIEHLITIVSPVIEQQLANLISLEVQ